MFERNWPFGGQGRPIDVPAPSGPGCIQISDLLARVDDNVGEYTFGGQADMLPPIPGLLINELSWVPVPLSEHQANELFTIDENRELQPDQVTFKSPLWQSGVQSLTQTVAERLGYKGVSMKCLLRKLVVFAEGSHFVQQDNTEKEDGMVATLVVQLPSVHEGDNLIVYRDDDEKHRYNFGKDDGTAAYLPHYAVLVADTEYVMEKVTSGCCLVLLYSLCLPPTMRYFTPSWEKGASEELAVAIASTKPEDKSFALLLEHEYDENSIVGLGCGALEGVDRARFRALAKANDKVSTDKKLMFFLTQVKSDPPLWAVDGEEYRHMLITWYTTAGECFGSTHESMNLNFPNPGQQAFSELWKPQKSKKKERCTVKKESTINTVTAYAIIAWPASESVNKALTEAAAVWALKNKFLLTLPLLATL